jgi:DNA repair protein RadA/Sms
MTPATAIRASEIDPKGEQASRWPTHIGELDRVLGGGLVRGSAVLVGGAPGIGKSTLLLQAADTLARHGTRVLYVSSEESLEQVRARLDRLRPEGLPADRHSADDPLFLLSDTHLDRIVEQARKVTPAVMVIDSIQMLFKNDLSTPAAPGSMTQLRRCCADLVTLAKLSGLAIVMVGHLTKADQLAGPRLLEHLVDAVLSFEGDRYHAHRVVRGIKNRFGTTLEVGLFEMTGAGLRPVPHGGTVIDTASASRPGSVLAPVMHGTRALLVEIQALTATGFLGAAKRKCSGLDTNRLAMLIAVLEQHAGMRLADRDIFASSVGGLRIAEPAADLALLLAMAGAQLKRGLAPATGVVGEVGLGGEIRPVLHLDQRMLEGQRLGLKRLIVPAGQSRASVPKGIQLLPVKTIDQAIEQLG